MWRKYITKSEARDVKYLDKQIKELVKEARALMKDRQAIANRANSRKFNQMKAKRRVAKEK